MNVLNVVAKWLIITAIVASVLLIILLGLGYLLNENEKQTKALVAEIEQAKLQAPKLPMAVETAESREENINVASHQKKLKAQLATLEQQQRVNTIIVKNLVCADVSQCRMIDTGQTSLGCVVAVNAIGESLLRKEDFGSKEPACEESISQLSLTCHHNICSIK